MEKCLKERIHQVDKEEGRKAELLVSHISFISIRAINVVFTAQIGGRDVESSLFNYLSQDSHPLQFTTNFVGCKRLGDRLVCSHP